MMTQARTRLTLLAMIMLLLSTVTSQAEDVRKPTSDDLSQASAGEECCVVPGDFNHDGELDPMDALFYTLWLWGWGFPPPCWEEADVNCSGMVDPIDVVYLVRYLWLGGPEPCPCEAH